MKIIKLIILYILKIRVDKMRIILIGFMGVGKTSVGRLLSKKLEVAFIDMALEIEK